MLLMPPYTPELLIAVQQWVYRTVPRGSSVLELGAGWSTPWFAERYRVLSFEHDYEWYCAAKSAAPSADVLLCDCPVQQLVGMADDQFDLALVDCKDEWRVECAVECMRLVKPGGFILLDDAHWELLEPAREQLRPWFFTRFDGRHTRHDGERKHHCTFVYRRP